MGFLWAKLVALGFATATVLADPTSYDSPPTVTLDNGTFIGRSNDGVNMFLGIPFAQSPLVVDIGYALSAWTDPHNRPFPTELATCASVCPSRLPPTPPGQTTQLRLVFPASNNQRHWQFRMGYLKRQLRPLSLRRQPHLRTVKIVRTQSWRLLAILTINIGLTLSVIVPADARPGSSLPVVVVCTRE